MAFENSDRRKSIPHLRSLPGVDISKIRRHSVDNTHSNANESFCSQRSCHSGDWSASIEKHHEETNGGIGDQYSIKFNNVDTNDRRICGIPINRKFRMAIYSFTYFWAGVAYSLPAPFYPQVATEKGISLTLTGFVFSAYQLVIFLTSPFFGAYLGVIGPKFAFTSGIGVAGACSILFGTLYMCPPGTPFFVLSLSVRAVTALGFASFYTALMAAGSSEYPENVATVMALFEGVFGVGLMVGPSIGALLYTYGGFGTPFYTLGAFVITVGLFAYVIMPPPNIENDGKAAGSYFRLLGSPLVWIAVLSTLCGSTAIGFMEPTLSTHLEPFGLSVVLISLFFIICPCAYTLASPFYGYLTDKRGIYKELIVIGQFIFGIGFLLTSPAYFLPFLPNKLWVVTIGLFVAGLSYGCTVVPNFKCILVGAVQVGFEENMNAYGLVAGIAFSAFSFGAFLGPMVGGVLVEHLGDRTAYAMIGLLNVVMSVVSLIILVIRHLSGTRDRVEISPKAVTEEADEQTGLIRH